MRPNFTDLSSVDKYELPAETYESLPNSVLAWKKNQKLGRFDPNVLSPEEALRKQAEKDQGEVASRGTFGATPSIRDFFGIPISQVIPCRHYRVSTGDHSTLVPAAYPTRDCSLRGACADHSCPGCGS